AEDTRTGDVRVLVGAVALHASALGHAGLSTILGATAARVAAATIGAIAATAAIGAIAATAIGAIATTALVAVAAATGEPVLSKAQTWKGQNNCCGQSGGTASGEPTGKSNHDCTLDAGNGRPLFAAAPTATQHQLSPNYRHDMGPNRADADCRMWHSVGQRKL